METSLERTTLKYLEIAHFIRSEIKAGKYRAGDILPGERALAERLKVSRPSVKRAIRVLEEEGVIECSPSIGSRVKGDIAPKILVGYLVKDLQDPFHLELIRELTLRVEAMGGEIIVSQRMEESTVRDMGMTALIKHHELYDPQESESIPTIYLGQVPGDHSFIGSDVEGGMELIYSHLRQQGHERIAYAGMIERHDDLEYNRLSELAERDSLNIPEKYRFTADPKHIEESAAILKRIEEMEDPPSVLVCYNDWLALTVMKAAEQTNLKIPEDLALTGYDDLFVSSLLQVPLTTVRFSRSAAADWITEILAGPLSGRAVSKILPSRLIVRASTANRIG